MPKKIKHIEKKWWYHVVSAMVGIVIFWLLGDDLRDDIGLGLPHCFD